MLITLLWSDIIKFFKLAIPKESKIKTGFFGWMSIILHQCVSCWSVLSVFEIREPYLICLLFTSWCMLITILIWFHRKNNNKFFKGVHFQNYWFFSILKFVIPFLLFTLYWNQSCSCAKISKQIILYRSS